MARNGNGAVVARVLCILLVVCTSPLPVAAVSVRDFGAVGDGKADDSEAFRRALEAADGELLVPAGIYRIANVRIPDDVTVRGVGVRSVILAPPDVEAAFLAGNNCTITDLKFVSDEADTASAIERGLVRLGFVNGVTLTRLVFENTPRAGVITDHAQRFRVTGCRFTNVGIAVHIVFSQYAIIADNFVENATVHGIQFWGNWKFERKECTNLTFIGNHVQNAGGGGIWGTGAVRVVISGNIVEGAGDVGLDYEWCDDSTIVGNTVRGAVNAGISLFLSCHNITISGNSVVIEDGNEGLRYGIWLTGTNKAKFPDDNGHRLIAITGNTIRAEGNTPRHGIDIGAESQGVSISDNLLENAEIADHTGAAKQ